MTDLPTRPQSPPEPTQPGKVSQEPVMIWGTLGTLVGALLLALMKQFMPDIGNDLMMSIADLTVFVVPVLGGLWYARSKVEPVVKIEYREAVKANQQQ